MRKKRTGIILLALMLCCTAGCGKKEEPSTEATTQFTYATAVDTTESSPVDFIMSNRTEEGKIEKIEKTTMERASTTEEKTTTERETTEETTETTTEATASGNHKPTDSGAGGRVSNGSGSGSGNDNTTAYVPDYTPQDHTGGSATFQDISKTVIGDSIMVGASSSIQAIVPNIYIDAEVGRQFTVAMDRAVDLDSQGLLGNCVIIELGTNGSFNLEKGQELINYLGPNRTIFWVNVYCIAPHVTWQDDANEKISALANANANVSVIDWAFVAMGHSEWFYDDGVHLNSDGQQAYADMVYNYLTGTFN